MEEVAGFVTTHGYALLALWVFLDQMGVPIPAIPVLIVAGSLAGGGRLDLGAAMLVSTLGSLPSDLLWFEAGRRRGSGVLGFICRFSLEPDSCVRGTEDTFARHGPRSLVIAKFVPGYQTLAPALAGLSGMTRLRFLAWDVPGAFLWSATFLLLGYLFRGQLDRVYRVVSELGGDLGYALVVALLGYAVFKFVQRQRFLRALRIARAGGAQRVPEGNGSTVHIDPVGVQAHLANHSQRLGSECFVQLDDVHVRQVQPCQF